MWNDVKCMLLFRQHFEKSDTANAQVQNRNGFEDEDVLPLAESCSLQGSIHVSTRGFHLFGLTDSFRLS